MGDQSYVYYTLDEALSAVGFGSFQCRALVLAGVGWFSEAMEMNLLSFNGPEVKSEWSLSPTEELLLSTAVLGGMLIGAYFWGFISDYYGRSNCWSWISKLSSDGCLDSLLRVDMFLNLGYLDAKSADFLDS